MHVGYSWESQKERATRRTKMLWVDNIKMDHREMGCCGMGWIDLAQDRD
jgi:hypothetical protein